MPAVKGREIRARRQGLGTKLGPFAELAGLKYKTLANIESGGQQAVSIEVVNRIVRAFRALGDDGVTADQLLAGEDTEAPAEPEGKERAEYLAALLAAASGDESKSWSEAQAALDAKDAA